MDLSESFSMCLHYLNAQSPLQVTQPCCGQLHGLHFYFVQLEIVII